MARRLSTIDVPLLAPDDGAARSRAIDHFLLHVRSLPGVRAAEVVEQDAQPVARITLDRRAVPMASLERIARHVGIGLRPRWGSVLLRVDGMASPQSEKAIEAALEGLPGVHATASFAGQSVRVEFDRMACQLPEIAMRLGRMGFRVLPTAPREPAAHPAGAAVGAAGLIRAIGRAARFIFTDRQLSAAATAGLLLLAGVIAERAGFPRAATIPVFLVVYVLAGWYTARDTFLSLRRGKFNIDVLMFVAAAGAGALGHWAEGALLLVLFAFGNAGEHLAMERARKAFEALYDAVPATAHRRDPKTGAIREVRAEELRPGDVIVVRPGDRVGADGSVIEGFTAIDQSAITGESTPVEKSLGAPVFAGTLNGDGAIHVRVERLASETTLAKAIRLVEEAQTQKSPVELFTAAIERRYVPLVLIATGALLIIAPLVSGGAAEHWRLWFYRSMAFLTAASPCALAIGTPAAILSALARAARMGVLIKGGAHIETLAGLRAAAFDKTGTLTIGHPRVVAVHAVNGATRAETLSLAAAIESSSAHPLARAIVETARAEGWDGRSGVDVEQIVGMGLRGRLATDASAPAGAAVSGNGELGARAPIVEVGSPRLFAEDPALAEVLPIITAFESEGGTAVAVRRDGAFVGVISLADTIRPDAANCLAELRRLGVARIVMLTGDNPRVASAIARRLGVDEHHASLLPEDKMRLIADLTKAAGRVAMVGDGVNDAPALAAASVGVAMGAAGADIALETADVALMHDNLSRFPEAVRLAQYARRIIAQNLAIALGVIAVLAPLAALGIASIGWSVLMHEGSTVVVVLNGLRLLAFRPRMAPAPASRQAEDRRFAARSAHDAESADLAALGTSQGR